jgi:hypothetical protein
VDEGADWQRCHSPTGDPLDPLGDLKAMRLANCVLKPDALLLVSVPVGKDIVAFNLHRRYGRAR